MLQYITTNYARTTFITSLRLPDAHIYREIHFQPASYEVITLCFWTYYTIICWDYVMKSIAERISITGTKLFLVATLHFILIFAWHEYDGYGDGYVPIRC